MVVGAELWIVNGSRSSSSWSYLCMDGGGGEGMYRPMVVYSACLILAWNLVAYFVGETIINCTGPLYKNNLVCRHFILEIFERNGLAHYCASVLKL